MAEVEVGGPGGADCVEDAARVDVADDVVGADGGAAGAKVLVCGDLEPLLVDPLAPKVVVFCSGERAFAVEGHEVVVADLGEGSAVGTTAAAPEVDFVRSQMVGLGEEGAGLAVVGMGALGGLLIVVDVGGELTRLVLLLLPLSGSTKALDVKERVEVRAFLARLLLGVEIDGTVGEAGCWLVQACGGKWGQLRHKHQAKASTHGRCG